MNNEQVEEGEQQGDSEIKRSQEAITQQNGGRRGMGSPIATLVPKLQCVSLGTDCSHAETVHCNSRCTIAKVPGESEPSCPEAAALKATM